MAVNDASDQLHKEEFVNKLVMISETGNLGSTKVEREFIEFLSPEG
jgi:hypothetical protein